MAKQVIQLNNKYTQKHKKKKFKPSTKKKTFRAYFDRGNFTF